MNKENRVLIIGLVIFFIVVAVFSSCSGTYKKVTNGASVESYTVDSGDTLYDIGKKYCPDSVNVMDWIECVKILNDMNGANIMAGETIRIYTYE